MLVIDRSIVLPQFRVVLYIPYVVSKLNKLNTRDVSIMFSFWNILSSYWYDYMYIGGFFFGFFFEHTLMVLLYRSKRKQSNSVNDTKWSSVLNTTNNIHYRIYRGHSLIPTPWYVFVMLGRFKITVLKSPHSMP